jgi:membrane protein
MTLLQKLGRRLKREQLDLPWRLIKLSAKSFFKDDGPTWAAAIAYYSLLSLFPLLLAAGSLAAHFVDPKWAVLKATGLLGDFLPKGQVEIEGIVQKSLVAGRGAGVLFILPLIWTGSLVFGAVERALNVTFEVEKRVSFLKRALVRLMMLLTLGGVFLLALSSSLLLRLLKFTLGVLPADRELIVRVVVDAVPALLVLLAFLLVYRFVPMRRPGWWAALIGAAISTTVFVAAKPLFLGYTQDLTRHNLIYGSLAGIVAGVVWAWVLGMIGIFGGQIVSHCQSVLFDGESIEEVERRRLTPAHAVSPRTETIH